MSSILLDQETPTHPRAAKADQPTGQPYLPLSNDWRHTNFTVEDVITTHNAESQVDLKVWTDRLIARYTWTAIGGLDCHCFSRVHAEETFCTANHTGHFAMLHSARDVANTTARLDAKAPSIIALNDDFDSFSHDPQARADTEVADGLMRQWMEQRWPEAGPWERED